LIAVMGGLAIFVAALTPVSTFPVVGVSPAGAAEATVADLGTLGGATSSAVAINLKGQVAGDSEVASGAVHAFRWARGHLKDLGTLGGRESHAVSINAAGDIAGYAQTSAGAWRAVLWPARGRIRNLGTLGGSFSTATDLSDQRHVVGTAERADGSRVAFRWTPNGGMLDLGTLGGNASSARAVNAVGDVAGQSQTEDGSTRAFAWTPRDGMRDLGTLGGRSSWAVAINLPGQVVGSENPILDDPLYDAFIWSPADGMQRLETDTAFDWTSPVAMNDVGDVAGVGLTGHFHGSSTALRWSPDGPVALQQPTGGDVYPIENEANDINADGLVVGSVTTAVGQRATRWADDGLIEYLPTLGGNNSWAVAINGTGSAVGRAETPDGAVHAVIWR
jgi:probable HAF family extracellular repeat protein